jgi:hypothetical protein
LNISRTPAYFKSSASPLPVRNFAPGFRTPERGGISAAWVSCVSLDLCNGERNGQSIPN